MGTSAAGSEIVRGGDVPDSLSPFRCETVLNILGKKWMIPVLAELRAEPRRRKYLFRRLRVSSSRLDPTIQDLMKWGLIERTWIPNGRTDGPGMAITDLGRSLLELVAALAEWQEAHQPELVANEADWSAAHPLEVT